jgi:hypothetical protein
MGNIMKSLDNQHFDLVALCLFDGMQKRTTNGLAVLYMSAIQMHLGRTNWLSELRGEFGEYSL